MTLPPIGNRIHFFESCTSTNDIALDLAKNDATHGTIVAAKEQSAGRGRQGRIWLSREGSLAISLILRPKIPLHLGSRITLLACVAVCDWLEQRHLAPQIKWPNDVLIDGNKVCGILVESQSNKGEIEWAIAGIGINLVRPTADAISDEVPNAGYIFDECRQIGEKIALFELLAFFNKWLDAANQDRFESALRFARQRSFTLGRELVLTTNPSAKLIAKELGEDGSLLVEDSNKSLHRVYAGEVIHL